MIAKGEEIKDELLDHPEVQAWFSRCGERVKRADAGRRRRPRQRAAPPRSTTGWPRSASGWPRDAELQAKIDDWVERLVAYVVENYKGEVADLIATTVERWDAADTSRRIELQVGRDLQFIRINGTVVGGLAGLVIYTVSQLLF